MFEVIHKYLQPILLAKHVWNGGEKRYLKSLASEIRSLKSEARCVLNVCQTFVCLFVFIVGPKVCWFGQFYVYIFHSGLFHSGLFHSGITQWYIHYTVVYILHSGLFHSGSIHITQWSTLHGRLSARHSHFHIIFWEAVPSNVSVRYQREIKLSLTEMFVDASWSALRKNTRLAAYQRCRWLLIYVSL